MKLSSASVQGERERGTRWDGRGDRSHGSNLRRVATLLAIATLATAPTARASAPHADATPARGGTGLFYVESHFGPSEGTFAMGAGYRRWLAERFTAAALLHFERPILSGIRGGFRPFAYVLGPTARVELARADAWSDRAWDLPCEAWFAYAGPTIAFPARSGAVTLGWRVGVGAQLVLQNDLLPAGVVLSVEYVDASSADRFPGHVRGGLGFGF